MKIRLIIAVAIAGVSSAGANAQESRSAAPRDQAVWAGTLQANYPAAALRSDEEGVVTMRIDIDETGRVAACTVTGSSESVALDEAACAGMTEHARYYPALNDSGDPVATVTTQSVRYVLPDGSTNITHPVAIDEAEWRAAAFDESFDRDLRAAGNGQVGYLLVIDEAGKPVACGLGMSSHNAALDRRGCAALLEHARFEPATLPDGSTVPGGYAMVYAPVTEEFIALEPE